MKDPLFEHHRRADRLMAIVLSALFVVSLALAPWYRTWTGVFAVGLPALLIPLFVMYVAPASLASRMTVAAALMVFCALNIHQAFGMTELHFGIFVLLAFLLCYRDWRPIVMAATVAAIHHFSFSYFQQLGYGVMCFTKPTLGILLVHASYVVVETIVLSYLAVMLRSQGLQAAELQGMVSAMMNADGKIDLQRGARAAKSVAGQQLNHLSNRLQSVVETISSGTATLAETAADTASNSDDLAVRTTEQRNALHETSSALDLLTATTRDNVAKASQANQLVDSAVAVATKGGAEVSSVVATMADISASSKRIADITSVIDEIAFQTNLLALNAAVEAARAGEQGRGFAVVAAEVRSLAQRCATAAKEIKELIAHSVSNVAAGSTLADRAGATMHEVIGSVRGIADIMNELRQAFEQQKHGLDEVNVVAERMTESTRHNAELVETMAAAASTLREHSEQLTQAVGQFEIGAPVSAASLPSQLAYERIQRAA